MQRRKPAAIDMNLTLPIDTTFGAFNIGDFRVPYLNTVLRANEVDEYLSLVTDDPKYSQHDWKIEELFQRDISYGRVLDIANNYLNPEKATRSPFFNSLTVVLTPKKLKEGQTYSAPPKFGDYPLYKKLGPIAVSYDMNDEEGDYPAPKSFGVMQWNREQVYAVAIDGQHRLAAIKHLCKKGNPASKNLYLSIIFLIIDEAFGFLTPNESSFDQIKYMRSIFIDLNKHAEPVSRARNLLLDDFDPIALFVKSLISPSLSYSKTSEINSYHLPIGTKGEFKSCLPLDLVDWHSEAKSKVDDGPYLTSILGLDWIVNTVLNKCKNPSRKVFNVSNYSPDDEKYYENLEKVFKTWPFSWEASIKKRLENCGESRPFSLSSEDLKNLTNEFIGIWAKPITRLLTGTACYASLSFKRVEDELISPQFAQWYQLISSQKNAKPGQEKEYYTGRLSIIEESLIDQGFSPRTFTQKTTEIENNYKHKRILFFLVGQRALILTLIELLNRNKIHSWAPNTDIDLDQFSTCIYDFCSYYLVEGLNHLYTVFSPGSDGLFEKTCKVDEENFSIDANDVTKYFWAGSLVKRDNPTDMDFSDAAAKRASAWFAFIVHLYWFLKKNNQNFITKEWILSTINDVHLFQDLPLGEELMISIGRLTTQGAKNDSPMRFLVGGIVEEPMDRPDMIFAAAKERIGYLCDLFVKTGLLKK
jgi:DGQHR domain-containing protein